MKTLRKISSLALIPILLWAGMGFMLNRHYCAGELVAEHFYHAQGNCGMELLMDESSCHDQTSEPGLHEKNCCQNEWIHIEQIETVKQDQSLDFHYSLSPAEWVLIEECLGTEQVEDCQNPVPILDSNPYRKTSSFLSEYQEYLI